MMRKFVVSVQCDPDLCIFVFGAASYRDSLVF